MTVKRKQNNKASMVTSTSLHAINTVNNHQYQLTDERHHLVPTPSDQAETRRSGKDHHLPSDRSNLFS